MKALILDTSVLCVYLQIPFMEECGKDSNYWNYQKIALGDITIKRLAQYYAQKGFRVEILTGDAGLKSYEPPPPAKIPKRRSDRA